MGREDKSTLELTAWDPPSGYSFRVADGPVPLEAAFRFEAVNGGTRLSAYSRLDAAGFFKIAEGLLKRQIQKQQDSHLGRLKELLENGS